MSSFCFFLHSLVTVCVDKEHRRQISTEIACGESLHPDPLLRAPHLLGAVGCDSRFLDPKEPADRHDAPDVVGGQLVRGQIPRIGDKERSQVSTCGMADDNDSVGVAPVLPDITFHPGKRRRDVLNVSRMRDLRRESITGHDSQVARRSEPLADKGLLGPVTLPQRAPMERDNTGAFVTPSGM